MCRMFREERVLGEFYVDNESGVMCDLLKSRVRQPTRDGLAAGSVGIKRSDAVDPKRMLDRFQK